MLKVNREEKWQCELRLPETVQMRAGRDGTLRETLADKNNEQTNRSHYFYLTFQLGRERINVIIKGAETGEYR